MPVERIKSHHPLWESYTAHLERVEMACHVIGEDKQPKPNYFFLGMRDGGEIIGHISLRKQPIVIPATAWSGGLETLVSGPNDEQLFELFVQTFAVDKVHRRLGHGRALQFAALDLTKSLGCYQMRSWSSLDKPANFALKISLGFSVHPATYETENGETICGAYFVKTV